MAQIGLSKSNVADSGNPKKDEYYSKIEFSGNFCGQGTFCEKRFCGQGIFRKKRFCCQGTFFLKNICTYQEKVVSLRRF